MFTILSKPNCPQCEMAKMLLQMKNQPFKVEMLGIDFTPGEYIEKTKSRSFPGIFKDGQFIGDLNALKQYFN